ncbi:hypothetical protein [Roseiconus lacunae]|uniref:hypothetical protein n=1 Tax=Roseiconus lacunae TaxID=2605694 RepID=UPI001E420C0A|nr:hypothetical protein [Roseiconus lacunae]MCD0458320.1 hypothetical protein [Roseiconus lacunae]
MAPLVLLGLSFLSGASVSDRDKALIMELAEKQQALIDEYNCVQAEVKTKFQSQGKAIETEGRVIWSEDSLRYDYELIDESNDVIRKGVLVRKGKNVITFYPQKDEAFRTISDAKDIGVEFAIRPQDSWFQYNLEFPYTDILTADGTFDFGKRIVTAERTSEHATIVIDNPDTEGEITFKFDLTRGGLLTSVVNRSSEGVKYDARIDWGQAEDASPFPESIKVLHRRAGHDLRLRYQIEFSNVNLCRSARTDQTKFSDASIGITDSTELTTYYKNRRPVVRRGKSDDSIKALGEQLRQSGFAKEKGDD